MFDESEGCQKPWSDCRDAAFLRVMGSENEVISVFEIKIITFIEQNLVLEKKVTKMDI